MSRQLPVYSPLTAAALWSGVRALIGTDRSAQTRLRSRIADTFGSRMALQTDSGTSALVLALRIALGARRGSQRVLLPAYACPDLLTAVDSAGVSAALYDIDPATLGPDFDDLERQLSGGAAAVVVAHLYGIPVDVCAVQSLAATEGALVIEDAAQGVGGCLDGRPLGSHGALGILSFGRGKGRTGGAGGACLANDPALLHAAISAGETLAVRDSGQSPLFAASMQWLAGRPELYGVVAVLAGDRLGVTEYHTPWEPRQIPDACAAVVDAVWDGSESESRGRRASAAMWRQRLAHSTEWSVPVSGAGARAEDGVLRLPVFGRTRMPPVDAALGVVRAYPRTLASYPESPASRASARRCLGAEALAERLVTVPVHGQLRPSAQRALSAHFAVAD